MKRTMGFLDVTVCALCIAALADYSFIDKGTWPKSWPKQLEPLRKQARTLEGPHVLYLFYAIPFTKRADFKAAWPYILKVKAKGAPVHLMRAPNFFLGGHNAGVVIHCPPAEPRRNPDVPERPAPGVKVPREKWANATQIDLIVDGDIISLDRKTLPADTLVVDDRTTDDRAKSPTGPDKEK